jgi:putative SOS response-associated peptidase YedK
MMIDRIAFFASKENLETFFRFQTKREVIFEPHYNLSPASQIPVILNNEKGETDIRRVRWGLIPENATSAEAGSEFPSLSSEEALSLIETGKTERCVIPVSGYFIWKNGVKKDHPFFVKMIHEPIMAIAGIIRRSDMDGNEKESCAIITTDANALISPIQPKMPLQLSAELSSKWINETPAQQVLTEAEKLFLLTDITTHRVSKKINDSTSSDPKMIQPIPK